jgi:hypothetical protein
MAGMGTFAPTELPDLKFLGELSILLLQTKPNHGRLQVDGSNISTACTGSLIQFMEIVETHVTRYW